MLRYVARLRDFTNQLQQDDMLCIGIQKYQNGPVPHRNFAATRPFVTTIVNDLRKPANWVAFCYAHRKC